jgi:hypothetical protein
VRPTRESLLLPGQLVHRTRQGSRTQTALAWLLFPLESGWGRDGDLLVRSLSKLSREVEDELTFRSVLLPQAPRPAALLPRPANLGRSSRASSGRSDLQPHLLPVLHSPEASPAPSTSSATSNPNPPLPLRRVHPSSPFPAVSLPLPRPNLPLSASANGSPVRLSGGHGRRLAARSRVPVLLRQRRLGCRAKVHSRQVRRRRCEGLSGIRWTECLHEMGMEETAKGRWRIEDREGC